MSSISLAAHEIADSIASGTRRAVDVVDEHLAAIERDDGDIHAFLSTCPERARAEAEAVDARRAAGEPVGPLAGVPIAIKDNICARNVPTTCASKILAEHRPLYDATALTRLQAAGAIMIGKTNLDEFAMGSSTENSAFVTTRNPWNTECVPGGSSGGSAAAVASRLAPIALGSDTGGSVRQPGALCGVVALKPTYGAVSRYGLVAFASSLDQIGSFSRNAEDARRVFNAIAGPDPHDSTSLPIRYEVPREELARPLAGLRIGVPRSLLREGLEVSVRERFDAALTTLEDEGIELVDVALQDTHIGVATYYIVACAEASSNLARYDGVRYGTRAPGEDVIAMYRESRGRGFGDEVKRRILLGTYVLSRGYYEAYYHRALRVRRLIRSEYDRALAEVDAVCTPTAPAPAFRVGEKTSDPLQMYLSDLFTISANLSSYPAISIPAGLGTGGLPVGIQFVADARGEGLLLRLAEQFLARTGYHDLAPAGDA